MKRLLTILTFSIIVFSLSTLAFADNRQTIVYIADSSAAERYHRIPNCVSLSRSSVYESTLDEAIRKGLKQCHICLPPLPDFSDDGYIENVVSMDVIESTGNAQPRIVSNTSNFAFTVFSPSLFAVFLFSIHRSHSKKAKKQTYRQKQNPQASVSNPGQQSKVSQESVADNSNASFLSENRMSDGTIIIKMPDGSSMFLFPPKQDIDIDSNSHFNNQGW